MMLKHGTFMLPKEQKAITDIMNRIRKSLIKMDLPEDVIHKLTCV
jgi:hypothetical protein